MDWPSSSVIGSTSPGDTDMPHDSVHNQLDILIHGLMETTGETGRSRGVILRTQWLTCTLMAAAVLTAVAIIFKTSPV